MENGNAYKNRILILADFSEGNQSAIDFSIKYLHNNNSKIYLVQTWQKPSYGTSMLRDLAPILKDISKRELNALKADILGKYQLKEDDVELLSYEGDLKSFFKSDWYKNHEWQMVLGLNERSSDLQYNPRFNEIVEAVNHPLYILNNCHVGERINTVYVRHENANLSTSILLSLERICSEQMCNVHVGLNINDITISEKAEIVKEYANACKHVSVRFEKLVEGYQDSLGVTSLLSIYHGNHSKKKERELLSYFDKWFVKSKGIRVGNF